jgi:hypothetical protein
MAFFSFVPQIIVPYSSHLWRLREKFVTHHLPPSLQLVSNAFFLHYPVHIYLLHSLSPQSTSLLSDEMLQTIIPEGYEFILVLPTMRICLVEASMLAFMMNIIT